MSFALVIHNGTVVDCVGDGGSHYGMFTEVSGEVIAAGRRSAPA